MSYIILISVIIAVCIVCIAVYLYFTRKNNASGKKTDLGTYYFKFIDVDGKESIIHDSGISSSLEPPAELEVLKTEYHEGRSESFNTPATIFIGKHHDNLDVVVPVTSEDVELDGLVYRVSLHKK